MANQSLVRLIIDGTSRGAVGAVNAFRNALTGLPGILTGITGLLTGFLGINFLKDSIDSAREFEAQMSVVQAKSGASAEDMAALTKVAQEMGSSTRYSATEAAQGLEILATAGVSAADSVKLLPTVLQTAQGAGISLAEAAGILTDSLGILGHSIDQAGNLADVLSKGALLANTSVSQLGQALKVAGGSARAAGLDLEQTTAALDALAANGVKSAEAGTALRNLLNELRNPASAARAALLQLGITTGDLPTVLQKLEGNAAGVGKVLDALTVDAQVAGRALFNVGAEGFAEFDRKLREAQGTAQQTAAVMDQNLNGALAGLASAWDALKQALVEPLLKPITQEIKDLAGAIQQATTDGTIDGFRDSLLGAFNTSTEGVRQFLREFDFKTALDRVGAFAKGAVESIQGVSSAVSSMANTAKGAWNLFEAGVEGIGAAISGLAAVVVESYGKVLETLDLIGLVPDRIKNTVVETGNFLRELSNEYAEAAKQDLAEAEAAWDALTGKINTSTEATRQAAVAERQRQQAEKEAIATAEAAEQAVLDRINAEIQAQQAIEQRAEADRQAKEAIKAQAAEIQRLQGVMAAAARSGDWQTWYAAWQDLERIGQQATEGVAQGAVAMSEELKAAFKTLGLSTQAELELQRDTAKRLFDELKASGQGTAEDLKRAFGAYADAARKAAELSTEAAKKALEADLEREAAALGIAQAKEKEAEGIKTSTAALREQISTYQGLTQAAKETADAKKEEGEAAEESNKAHRGAIPVARENSVSYSLMGEAARAAADAIYDGTRAIAGQVSELERTRAKVTEFTTSFKRLKEITGAEFGGNFGGIIAMMDRYADQLRDASALQDQLTASWEQGTLSMRQLNHYASQADQAFDLLDDQQLEGLRAAIRDARAEIQGMEDDARRAAEAIEEELLRAQGQQDILLKREYDRRRREFEQALETAQTAGNQEAARQYQQALTDLKKLHQIRMADLKEEHETAGQYDQERRRQAPSPAPARGAGMGAERTVRLEFANELGRVVGAGDFEPDQAAAVESLLRQLARARGTALQ